MQTALLLAAMLGQTGSNLTLTVAIPATVPQKAEIRIYSDSRDQWLDFSKTPPAWADAPVKLGGLVVAKPKNPDARDLVIPALDPGTYRAYTYLLIPTSTNGGPVVDVPAKFAYSSATLIVEPSPPPPVVTVTVTQPK